MWSLEIPAAVGSLPLQLSPQSMNQGWPGRAPVDIDDATESTPQLLVLGERRRQVQDASPLVVVEAMFDRWFDRCFVPVCLSFAKGRDRERASGEELLTRCKQGREGSSWSSGGP